MSHTSEARDDRRRRHYSATTRAVVSPRDIFIRRLERRAPRVVVAPPAEAPARPLQNLSGERAHRAWRRASAHRLRARMPPRGPPGRQARSRRRPRAVAEMDGARVRVHRTEARNAPRAWPRPAVPCDARRRTSKTSAQSARPRNAPRAPAASYARRRRRPCCLNTTLQSRTVEAKWGGQSCENDASFKSLPYACAAWRAASLVVATSKARRVVASLPVTMGTRARISSAPRLHSASTRPQPLPD